MLEIQKFIKQRPYLVWYVKDPSHLNDEAIVEHVLNYGNWEDVRKMIDILGVKKTAKIFSKQVKQKRCNYHKKTKSYFTLYFNKYVYA